MNDEYGTSEQMIMEFDGFPRDTVKFLCDLKNNNNKKWFDEHRATYEAAIKVPAKTFSEAMERDLEKLTGTAHNAKIFRINRDVRFSKDKTPYNTHVHVSFAPDVEASVTPVWSFGLAPKYLTLGVGIMGFEKRELEAYRKRVDSPAGAMLAKHIAALPKLGARLGGEPELKRVPKEFPVDHPREALLRRKSLTVWMEIEELALANRPQLIKGCTTRYKKLMPIFEWLSELCA